MTSRWDRWVARYKPIQNTIAQHRPEFMFETYGVEYQFIVETNEKEPGKVWTLTEGDSGRLYVTDGWHYVNRFGYFVTAVSFEPSPKTPYVCIPY